MVTTQASQCDGLVENQAYLDQSPLEVEFPGATVVHVALTDPVDAARQIRNAIARRLGVEGFESLLVALEALNRQSNPVLIIDEAHVGFKSSTEMPWFWSNMQKAVTNIRYIISSTRSRDYTPGDSPSTFQGLSQVSDELLLQPDQALAHLKVVGKWIQGPDQHELLATSDGSVLRAIVNYCCGQLGPMMKLCHIFSGGDILMTPELACDKLSRGTLLQMMNRYFGVLDNDGRPTQDEVSLLQRFQHEPDNVAVQVPPALPSGLDPYARVRKLFMVGILTSTPREISHSRFLSPLCHMYFVRNHLRMDGVDDFAFETIQDFLFRVLELLSCSRINQEVGFDQDGKLLIRPDRHTVPKEGAFQPMFHSAMRQVLPYYSTIISEMSTVKEMGEKGTC